MHRISTSVSGDWITMELAVSLANFAWSSRRVSASSWEHFSSSTSAIVGEYEVPAKQILWQVSEWPMKRVKECPRPSCAHDLMKNSMRSSLFFPQDKYFFHWAGIFWPSEKIWVALNWEADWILALWSLSAFLILTIGYWAVTRCTVFAELSLAIFSTFFRYRVASSPKVFGISQRLMLWRIQTELG